MSAQLNRIRPQDYREMPWRNGGGATTEIVIHPPGATASSPFIWRLSMAAVTQDGPFSQFAGYDRTLVLLQGGGLVLHFGDSAPPKTLTGPLQSSAFAGEWATHGRLLAGPVRDFNVMVDRQRAKALVKPLDLPAQHCRDSLVQGHSVLLFVLQGGLSVRLGAAHASEAFMAGETMRFDSTTPEAKTLELRTEAEPAQVVLVDITLL